MRWRGRGDIGAEVVHSNLESIAVSNRSDGKIKITILIPRRGGALKPGESLLEDIKGCGRSNPTTN